MCLLPPRPARLQSCLTWGPVEVGDTQAESAQGPLDSSQHVLQAVHLPASCRAHPGPQTSKYRKRLLLDPKPLKEEESQEGGDESCTQGKRKLRLTPKCPPRPCGSISNGDWGGGRNSVLGNRGGQGRTRLEECGKPALAGSGLPVIWLRPWMLQWSVHLAALPGQALL